MTSPLPGRVLPGAPRRAVAPVAVAAGLHVLLAVLSGAVPVPARAVLQAVLTLVAVAATGWTLVRRARRPSSEQRTWRTLGFTCLVQGLGVTVSTALTASPATAAWASAPTAAAALIVFPTTYRALVRWTRHSTSAMDPDDMLNGISSVLVATAVAQTVLQHAHRVHARAHAHGLPASGALDGFWSLDPSSWLAVLLSAQNAALLVVVLTAATAARLSTLRIDPRLWLVTASFALAGVDALSTALDGGLRSPWTGSAWVWGLVCLALATVLPVTAAPQQAADPAGSTVGAYVVVVAAVCTTAVAVLSPTSVTVVVGALLAVVGSSTRLLINLRDLTQLATSRVEALTDDLTGTANRRAVLQRLQAVMTPAGGAGAASRRDEPARGAGGGSPRGRDPLTGPGTGTETGVVLAVFDLDHFEEVNDALGHAAGDDLLRTITQRVQPLVPAHALFGRLGGDEFAVLVPLRTSSPDELHEHARQLGERLLGATGESFPLAGMNVHAALSVGVSTWSAEGHLPAATTATTATTATGRAVTASRADADAAALLRQADAAMYDAKRGGGGLVHHDHARHGDSQGLSTLAEDLRRAVAGGQLRLHHQPQVDVASARLAGVEALVRWQHPVLGLLVPAQFVALAEAHGLMSSVTREVLHQAITQLAAWRAAGVDLRMSVNLSASDLLDTGLPTAVPPAGGGARGGRPARSRRPRRRRRTACSGSARVPDDGLRAVAEPVVRSGTARRWRRRRR